MEVETAFSSEIERALFEQTRQLKVDRDRLLRKADSLEEENRKLRELIKIREVREFVSPCPLL